MMVLAAALDFSWEEGALEWSLAVRSRFDCALAPLPIFVEGFVGWKIAFACLSRLECGYAGGALWI